MENRGRFSTPPLVMVCTPFSLALASTTGANHELANGNKREGGRSSSREAACACGEDADAFGFEICLLDAERGGEVSFPESTIVVVRPRNPVGTWPARIQTAFPAFTLRGLDGRYNVCPATSPCLTREMPVRLWTWLSSRRSVEKRTISMFPRGAATRQTAQQCCNGEKRVLS